MLFRWEKVISRISRGSLDERVVKLSGEAPAVNLLQILARIRNQISLASSSITAVTRTQSLNAAPSGAHENYLVTGAQESLLHALRLVCQEVEAFTCAHRVIWRGRPNTYKQNSSKPKGRNWKFGPQGHKTRKLCPFIQMVRLRRNLDEL